MSPEQIDVGLITMSLNHIINALSGGYARISGATNTLMWIFVVLDVTLFGIMLALELDAYQSGFKKLLAISGWLYFIQDFEKHANAIVNSLVSAGLMLGGQSGSDWRMVLDPSRILSKGFSLTKVLLDNLPPWYQMGITDWIGSALAFVLILTAFFIIAANAYILVIGFYLALGICGALLPFGLLPWTRSFAMKGITSVVAHGVHLMLVAVATSLAETVVQNLKFSDVPTLHETWSMVFAVGTIAILAWIVPQRFSQGFMSGAASLGAADATALAAPAVALAAGAVAGPAGAAAVAQAQQSGERAAGRGGSGVRVSQSIQPPHSGAGPSASAAAAARGNAGGAAAGAGTRSPQAAASANEPILAPPESPR
jgi:type IV secretion system protein TrbL